MGKVSKKIVVKCVFLIGLAVILCILCRNVRLHTQWEREHSGIPDVVSSRTQGNKCVLTVVANADEIEDEQAFAEETVRKYEENSFHTTRFSRDQKKLPCRVYMSVYLRRDDIGRDPAVFSIEYDAENKKFEIIK